MRFAPLGALTVGISVLAAAPAMAQMFASPHAEIAAAETNINISLGFMHTGYSEGPPDSESGFTPGFSVGGSVLLPSAFTNIDLYTALAYQFHAGNLTYTGHYLISGEPVTATDNAVFNNINARFGLGFPLAGGALEAIPYITMGYQAWNRNINNPGVIGTDEFYSAGMAGGGMKLDVPVTGTIVVSGTADMVGMFGVHLSADSLGTGFSLGNSAQQRVSLGVDDALSGPLHVFANAGWTHFNYAGSKPSPSTYIPALGGEIFEPLSTTNQVTVNLGVSYSF